MRRAQFAAAIIHQPKLLLLDEPTAGLDHVAQSAIWMHLHRLAANGVGIIVSTHDLVEAQMCTRVAVYRQGKVMALASPEKIITQLGVTDFVNAIATLISSESNTP
jgi:ABC-2 type transport system ATP-binding protein